MYKQDKKVRLLITDVAENSSTATNPKDASDKADV